MSVCDSCLDVIYDNYLPNNLGFYPMRKDPTLEKDMESFCISMGSDIEDHDCDETETGGETLCQCACHPRRRKQPV
jgi:hypothetical protein